MHQLPLPRQSHTAEGPHDQTGMYVMHHALRRDLDRFAAAVAATPEVEGEVWTALERRWLKVAEILHHHHGAEDDSLWPVLRRHAQEQAAQDDLRVLAEMEAEHDVIDPAVTACGEPAHLERRGECCVRERCGACLPPSARPVRAAVGHGRAPGRAFRHCAA